MKRSILPIALAALLAGAAPLPAAGPLTPPAGAPAPTMKSLQEIWDKLLELEAALAAQDTEFQTFQKDASFQNLSIQSLIGPLYQNLGIELLWKLPTIAEVETILPIIGGNSTSLAFHPRTGQPAIAYYDDSDSSLRYAAFDGAAWQTSTVESAGSAGRYCSLAFHPFTAQPAISYHYIDSSVTHRDLRYAVLAGGTWQITTVDTVVDTDDTGKHTSLAFNPFTGLPTISFSGSDPSAPLQANALKIAAYDGVTWLAAVLDDGTYGVETTSLALHPLTGNPAIAYYVSPIQEIRYAALDGLTWQISTVASTNLSKHPSLAFTPSGVPAIAYYQTLPGELIYAELSGFFWATTTVDGSAGRRPSLAFGPTGRSAIGYRDSTNDDLKLATFDGAAWQTEVVDDRGGDYVSLAFSPTGQPAMSYIETSSDVLRYAVKAPYFSP